MDNKHHGADQELKSKKWAELKTLVGQQVQISKAGGNYPLDRIMMKSKAVRFDSIVCQSTIKTKEDVDTLRSKGYNVELTMDEFQKSFTVDPNMIWYTHFLSLGCFYFNPDTLAACPFPIEFYIHKIGAMNIESAYEAFKAREKEVAEGWYIGSATTLPDVMRLEYLRLLIEKNGPNIQSLYHLFLNIYSNSDYGFSDIDNTTLQTILQCKTEEEKAVTTEQLSQLPELVTIYRGGNSESTPYDKAYSWTTDINVANFFAIRMGDGPGYIAKGTVKKKDIIECLFNKGDEKEILVDPSSVSIDEVIPVRGLDLLERLLPTVSPLYHEYRNQLYNLDFNHPSSIHGWDHEARVLLLCLIISELLNLPASDKKILATAAIYHDTRRTHDWVEPGHGAASSAYYHEHVKNPDPIVEFLCEYHCRPDEEGYEEIKRNRKLSTNRSRVTRLFQIFKDADGLERIRLGNLRVEMDLNQYRLPVTRELTLIAKLCYEHIEV